MDERRRRAKLLDKLERAHWLVVRGIERQLTNPRGTDAAMQGRGQAERREREFDETLAELRRDLGLGAARDHEPVAAEIG